MANKITGSLDTNALLRLVLGDMPEQARAVKDILDQSDELHIADPGVLEMVFVMERVYKLERHDIARNVLAIIRHPKINSNRRLFELTLPIYIEHPKLSIVDCVLTQYAMLGKSTPVYTFDKDLAKKCPQYTALIS